VVFTSFGAGFSDEEFPVQAVPKANAKSVKVKPATRQVRVSGLHFIDSVPLQGFPKIQANREGGAASLSL
jgi:hypothetical protein